MSFVSIVAPSETYKKYINLVAGFILMFIMIEPITNIINLDFENTFNFEIFQEQVINISESVEIAITELLESEGFNVFNVTARMDNTEIRRIEIRLLREHSSFFRIEIIDESRRYMDEDLQEIRSLISYLYNIDESIVFISYIN